MDHIGIDVHKRESQIYILAEGGEVVEQRIRTEPGRFAAVLGPRPHARILLEAATDSEWVARCLEALGHEVIVADPNFAPMYATRSRKVKTDRRDARALAEACLFGAYRPAHRLSDPQRHVRGRLLVRDAVVRTRPRYISLIRALLRQHGFHVPSGSAESFVHRVQGLPLPGRLRSVVAPLLALLRPLNRQLTYSDATIEHLAVQDPRVPRLRSVPCVGPVTAAAFLAAIDDVGRFHRAHQLEAYLALVPREYSSGETQRRGPITKAGHSRTRWLLIQAAFSILRRRPPHAEELRTWALRIAARRGKQVAVVALARRLAGILYALLRDGSVFEQRVRPPRPTAAALVNVSPRRRRSDDVGPDLSQVRWVGEREVLLGCCRRAAA
jgi:transposase